MTESAAGGLPVIRDVYPYLCVRDAAAAIELRLGPVVVMLVDEHPEYGIRSPLAFGGSGRPRVATGA